MNGIGELFRVTREESGVSLSEASKDLDIKEVILQNIEEGNIGCFKDIYVLKDNIYNYSKYLGIDSNKVIDDFNEYMFEYTSKIPLNEIEKKIQEEVKNDKTVIASPYTRTCKKHPRKIYILIYSITILLFLIVLTWSVKQIIISRGKSANISIKRS